jgi:hypothetical protein
MIPDSEFYARPPVRPALDVHRNRKRCRVAVRILDMHGKRGYVPAKPHRTDAYGFYLFKDHVSASCRIAYGDCENTERIAYYAETTSLVNPKILVFRI